MGRKVIKLLPDRMIFVGKIESWLKDMAKQGLILKRIRLWYAVFEEGEPQDIEYRIVAKDKLPSEKIMKDIEANGWTLVSKNVGRMSTGWAYERVLFYIFESRNSVYKKDVHDIYDFALWLKRRWKVEMKQNTATIILWIVAILLCFIRFSGHMFSHAFISMLEGLMFFLIVFLIWEIIFFRDRKKMKTLEKEYMHKDNINHSQDWNRKSKRSIVMIISFLLYIMMFFAVFTPIIKFFNLLEGEYLGDVDNLITLSEIEYSSNYSPGVSCIDEDGNCAIGYKQRTISAPIQYYAREYGKIQHEDTEDTRLSLMTNYCKTLFPWYASLIYKYESKEMSKSAGAFTTAGSDNFSNIAYIVYDSGVYNICFQEGKELIYIRYEGDLTPQELIDAIDRIFD